MALVLAATGIFGVISYSVACRKHEIGIRVALGASRGAILGLVSRETLILISAGLILGGISALVRLHACSATYFSACQPATRLHSRLSRLFWRPLRRLLRMFLRAER